MLSLSQKSALLCIFIGGMVMSVNLLDGIVPGQYDLFLLIVLVIAWGYLTRHLAINWKKRDFYKREKSMHDLIHGEGSFGKMEDLTIETQRLKDEGLIKNRDNPLLEQKEKFYKEMRRQ